MRSSTRLVLVGVVVGGVGCLAVAPEPRGTTRAQYAGAVPVVFTNASPERMCGLFMSFDQDDDYGDNWLPEEGVPSGGSVQLRVKPGKYKARWDTCKTGKDQPYYAATLWRETAVVVDRQTQLYAYVADAVAPTKRAAAMGRDHRVVRFTGQAINRNPKSYVASRAHPQQVAPRPPDEPPPIAGFVGLVVLDAEQVAERRVIEKFDARGFVDPGARLVRSPAVTGKGVPATTATGGAAAGTAAAVKQPPPGPRPSLNRKHELADSVIEYRKH